MRPKKNTEQTILVVLNKGLTLYVLEKNEASEGCSRLSRTRRNHREKGVATSQVATHNGVRFSQLQALPIRHPIVLPPAARALRSFSP